MIGGKPLQRLYGEPAGRYRALSAFNRPLTEAHAELAALVRARLGTAAASLFSEPRVEGGNLTWYVAATSPPARLIDLTGQSRDAATAACKDVMARAAMLAETLSRSGANSRDGAMGVVLRAALEVPSAAHIWVAEGQPVFTFWGFRGEPPFDPLAPRALDPPAASVCSARRRTALPLLAAAIFAACLGGWFAVGGLPRTPPVADPPGHSPSAPLRPDPAPTGPVPRVEPVAPPAPAPPLPVPVPPKPEPGPPPPEPKPPPAPPANKADNLMHVPENGDLSALKGCWRTDTYRAAPGAAPGRSSYCFDGSGRGTMTHSEAGVTCSAPAHAELRGPIEMHLVDQNSRCSDGSLWQQDRLYCKADAGGVAHCAGASSGASGGWRWSTTLHRAGEH
jgi:hypothetical protein